MLFAIVDQTSNKASTLGSWMRKGVDLLARFHESVGCACSVQTLVTVARLGRKRAVR